jgi:hypothetical protein
MSREPTRWYKIFIRYYLAGGFGRSVRDAWLTFLRENEPDKVEEAESSRSVPRTWMAMATRWEWHERAEAWEEQQSVLSMAAVEASSRKLRSLTPGAVDALASALVNPKQAVRAAAEILNRGGLPAVSKQEVDQTVSLSVDDMAAAAEELDEWTENKRNESG